MIADEKRLWSYFFYKSSRWALIHHNVVCFRQVCHCLSGKKLHLSIARHSMGIQLVMDAYKNLQYMLVYTSLRGSNSLWFGILK